MIRYVSTNLTDLHREPSFLSELLTQVMTGVELTVLKEQDKWCYVRQTDGYEGWAFAKYLTETAPKPPTHVVVSPIADVTDDAGRIATRLLAGTFVHAVEDGPYLRTPAGCVRTWNLRALPLAPSRQQIVADARTFTGTYYLWGGGSAWGIDCSGLAQLAHRLNGIEIPRDCYLQFPVGKTTEPPFHPGDLLYFWNEAKTKPGHVGIATGDGWNIIHSSRSRNGVYEEDVQLNDGLRESFMGARSFLR